MKQASFISSGAAHQNSPYLIAFRIVSDGLLGLNQILLQCSMVALLLSAIVLSYGMCARYFFAISTEWQDELAVFLLVGATFLSCSWVQARRGHIAIEAVAEYLTPRANQIRLVIADALSGAFCTFFAWKSWSLFIEAWSNGQTTTSSWGPPLSIPYFAMAAGMTLLSLQLLLQLASNLSPRLCGVEGSKACHH